MQAFMAATQDAQPVVFHDDASAVVGDPTQR
jgi:hypothetical protein